MTKSTKKISIFETFGGIGAQLLALKEAAKEKDFEVKSLGFIDWYIYAIISHEIIHYGIKTEERILTKNEMAEILEKFVLSTDSKQPIFNNHYFKHLSDKKLRKIFPYLQHFLIDNKTVANFTDIKEVHKIPKNIDIFTYSFPCQDISQQGKQKGITEDTRSGLLYQIERILQENKDSLPRILIMENVKALASNKFEHTLNEWIESLKTLGYKSIFQVLNSADYGSFQNRERVFMVSSINLDGFTWPEKHENHKKLSQIIKFSKTEQFSSDAEKNLQKYLADIDENSFHVSKKKIFKTTLEGHSTFKSEAYLYCLNGLGPTLTASGANSRLKFYCPHNHQIRMITPFQSYLYMGFNKKIAKDIIEQQILSNSQMIFTCGNSISIEALKSLLISVVNMIEFQDSLSQKIVKPKWNLKNYCKKNLLGMGKIIKILKKKIFKDK